MNPVDAIGIVGVVVLVTLIVTLIVVRNRRRD